MYKEAFSQLSKASEELIGGPLPDSPHALRLPWSRPPTLDPIETFDVIDLWIMERIFCPSAPAVRLSRALELIVSCATAVATSTTVVGADISLNPAASAGLPVI